jgi:hypothetical protein
MHRFRTLLFTALGLLLLAGCTTDHLKQGLYEGLRTRNDLQSSPAERIGKPDSPNYQEYQRLQQRTP